MAKKKGSKKRTTSKRKTSSSSSARSYVFMHAKPKGLKKYPKKPKAGASIARLERYVQVVEAVDRHNAPILAKYRALDMRMKSLKERIARTRS